MCRLAADGTALVDKQVPGFSTKLERLNDLLIGLMAQPDRKVVLFSEWTSMLDLIEPLLEKLSVSFVRLDGSVPQAKRPPIVHRFQHDPDCRLFMTTNAGSTGLNLQAANTVINVDLPWNPAVLEQRIARAHRMGQTSPVQVFVLVTNETIEENLLGTLSAKHSLALACLDTESEADVVTLQTGIDELKGRLEKLLGAQADAPEERIQQEEVQRTGSSDELRNAVATAGGEMMQAAISFFAKFAPAGGETEEATRQAAAFHEKLLECVEKKDDGTLSLNITLPGEDALRDLSKILCGMVK
jgi:superfamily II DNA/RNA helicase